MKENSMTKLPPYDTLAKEPSKLASFSMSHICRILLALGFVKLSMLAAIGFGIPLPQITLPSLSALPSISLFTTENTPEQEIVAQNPEAEKQEKAQQDAEATGKLNALMTAKNIEEPALSPAPKIPNIGSTDQGQTIPNTPSAQNISNDPSTTNAPIPQPAYIPSMAQAYAEPKLDPQGSAAIRALASLKPNKAAPGVHAMNMPIHEAVHTAQTPQAPQHRVTQNIASVKKPEQKSPSWWNGLSSIKNLPIPLLGVDQVAYAATLESPPNPTFNSSGNASPFSPPEQILPAGVAGPQVGIVPPNPLVPNPNPPSPNIDAYVPKEDPLRKQEELARREQEILMLQKQVEQRLQELQSAEKKVQNMLQEAKTVEKEKVDGLTNMYVNMKPKQAALAMEKMEEATAVKILSSMKSKQAGEILSYMNPTTTAKLTELISRMKLGQ